MGTRVSWCCAVVAVAGLAGSAAAGPGAKSGAGPAKSAARARTVLPTVGTDGGPFTENFDTYANGSNIAGQGGWEIWYTGGVNGQVTNAQAASAPNSLRLFNLSDIVQRFSITDGKWTFKVKTFVPSSSPPGLGCFIIMLNQYGGPDNWSMQIALNDTTSGTTQTQPYMVESQWDGALLPLILDQWVEFRAEIDLDADTWDSFYGGQPLSTGLIWTNNNFASGPGITSIAALDLFSFGMDPAYYDDVSLVQEGGCYPDCDGNSTLNVNDYICFQTKFALGDPYADCDSNGVRNVNDYICFQTKFALGC